MNKKYTAIESLRKNLNESRKPEKKITLKEMIYDDEYEEYEDSPGYESVPELPHENAQENGADGENKPIDRNKPIPGEAEQDPEIMKMLSDIRLAVINGLAKLANKPDSTLYDCLKKVLTIIDKPIEVANKQ
ncbi:MAG: hypothetical protein J6X18_05605 [Bacteroidales bacterium]|nr:hypothetical protein [Bacteroidales bacterium]